MTSEGQDQHQLIKMNWLQITSDEWIQFQVKQLGHFSFSSNLTGDQLRSKLFKSKPLTNGLCKQEITKVASLC